jgi:MFS family permease
LSSLSRGRLWKHNDFLRFWFGNTITEFTGQITGLALPTIAILLLHISVFEVGILGAIQYIAFPALGLFVGVWVDRYRRRRILILCNAGELFALASIPITYVFGLLNIYQIFAIAAANGVFQVFFDVAYQAYLPTLVEPSDLLEGNTKLQTTASAASVVGPTLAGFLISLIGAAKSIAIDAASNVVCIFAWLSIKKTEEIVLRAEKSTFVSEVRDGVKVIVRSPLLSTMTCCVATINIGNTIASTVFLFYAYNELHLTPLLVGILGTAGGAAFLISSVFAGRIASKLGTGKAIGVSILFGFGYVGYTLALVLPAFPTLLVFSFIASFGVWIFNITSVTMYQKITPNRLLGRMTATRRAITWGVIPAAALISGELGATIGLPATIAIGGLISGGSVLWAVIGPVHKIKDEDLTSESNTR